MSIVTAVALHDVEFNGVNGRESARSGATIRVSEDECLALEAMGAARRERPAASAQPSRGTETSKRRSRKRGKAT